MEKWEESKGENTHQIGGPPIDNTNGDTSGKKSSAEQKFCELRVPLTHVIHTY